MTKCLGLPSRSMTAERPTHGFTPRKVLVSCLWLPLHGLPQHRCTESPFSFHHLRCPGGTGTRHEEKGLPGGPDHGDRLGPPACLFPFLPEDSWRGCKMKHHTAARQGITRETTFRGQRRPETTACPTPQTPVSTNQHRPALGGGLPGDRDAVIFQEGTGDRQQLEIEQRIRRELAGRWSSG